MEVIIKDIKELKEYKNNPRKNDNAVEAVAQSIKEFGFKVPIIIDKDNVIICGHTRLKASLKLGLKEVPCVIANDLTDEQIKAYRLADNKTSELSEWDLEKLSEELQVIGDLDMRNFGFDLDISFNTETEEDDFVLENELREIVEPVAKVGDIWMLGAHTLMCGDSTNSEQVLKLMCGEVADLLITDPPYGIDYEGKTKDKMKFENDGLDEKEFTQFLLKSFSNAKEVLRPGGVFYIWYASKNSLIFYKALHETGLYDRQNLIWLKNNATMGRQDYQWKHEPCLYGWKDGAPHFWSSDRKQTTILEFDKPQKNDLHPTMKPIKLFDYQIRNSTKVGDIALDLFGGSGTTIMACEQNKRKARCMELDEKYCDVIINRWEKFTGNKAVLKNER